MTMEHLVKYMDKMLNVPRVRYFTSDKEYEEFLKAIEKKDILFHKEY